MTTPPQRPGRHQDDRPEDGHPGADEVDALLDADLTQVRDREGAEGPPPEALVAAHVLGCERCQGVLADLRDVRGLLRARAAGVPPPPPDLQARISAAVAQDAVREQREGRRRRRRAALALAASGVLVAGLGTAVALSAVPVTGGDDAGAAGADAGGAGSDDGGGGGSVGDVPMVMASGTDYAPGQVASQVSTAVAGDGSPGDGAGGRPPTDEVPGAGGTDEVPGASRTGDAASQAPARTSGLSDPARLTDCLEALGRPGAAVLVVDSARWEGEPADVLVVDARTGGSTGAEDGSPPGRPVQVWVVAPGCAGGETGLRHFEVLDEAPAGPLATGSTDG